MEGSKKKYLAAVIGAGPAGLYASRSLARQGVQVVLFNRDIRPGGLAEYGIFPDKHKMRTGLLEQFKRILDMPGILYLGNITIGKSGDLTLDQLRKAGFQAFMVTTGAQENNWLGLPGEDLEGVYAANDIVFHNNHLPKCSDLSFDFGKNVAIIGAGNVMLDIVHYLEMEGIPRSVTAFARRGPGEVKFDQPTLEPVAGCLEMQGICKAVDFARQEVEAVGTDLGAFFELLERACQKALVCDSGLKFQIHFIRSPRRLLGDENGRVREILFEVNHLRRENNQVVSHGTGVFESFQADTVIFSTGSHVDESFGLPVAYGNYVTTPEPRFPIDGISYEVYNPELCMQCEDIFVSGWARQAADGIVGLARKDAERGARALLGYLNTLSPSRVSRTEAALDQLPPFKKPVVDLEGLQKLWKAEQNIAIENGLQDFKFKSQAEMLQVIKKL